MVSRAKISISIIGKKDLGHLGDVLHLEQESVEFQEGL
jgi:hypothetical protein